ncbi:Tim44 domain-containing protein [Roseomonas sp. BN140053]|uniref:Tim44 domain-containing protein n=1 Tax=Roseomonas sp. BN140053 TaxID=3391898 RepID=UPI0039EBA808
MTLSVRRGSRLLAALAVVAMTVAPMTADARPGGGFSSGSRGSRSYSAPPSTSTAPNGGSTFNRTEAPRGGATTPGYGQASRPNYTPAPVRSGFGGGFFSGLAGGLLGAGIAGMLFGHGAFGGMSGGAGFLGFLLQIALIVGAAMLVMRFFRRRAAAQSGLMPAVAGAAPRGYARDMQPSAAGGMAGAMPGGAPASTPLQVTPADFESFERALVEVNAAWSRGDTATLERLATPEMARYFAGDLRDLSARGWRNETRDVRLEAGDLSEAWREQGQDYATVAMRFSLVDVTRDTAGRVVEGDPEARQTVTELWTFTRRPGGAQGWQVSAIQQAR